MQESLQRAADLIQRKEFAAAEEILKKLVTGDGATAEMFFRYGLCLTGQGHHREALDAYLRAIAMQDNWAPPYLFAALECRNLGDFEKAFECFRKHLELAPDSWDGFMNYGDALMTAGRRDEAMEAYLAAVKINPDVKGAPLLTLFWQCVSTKGAAPDFNSFRERCIAAEAVDAFFSAIVEPSSKTCFWGDRLLTLDKSGGFMRDPVFTKANSERLLETYDQYRPPQNIEWRLNTLVWAGRQALRLEGDFVECGVFRGDMSWVVAKCLNFSQVDRTFYLYDSFSGFSPTLQTKEDYALNPDFLAFAQKSYSEDADLASKVAKRFSVFPNVRVIPGFVPESFEKGMPEKIAYLHVDLNSPKAEIAALEVLFDRIVPGGVIVFDDYGWADFGKQKEAEDAWFSARGLSVMELPTGQGLVVKV